MMKKLMLGLSLGLSLVALVAASPAVAFMDSQETIAPLGPKNMYVLVGQHAGNITLAVGSDAAIVVDTQFAPYYKDIRAKIASVTKLPLKYAIDSHYHGDHTGGNEQFHKDGAILVSTANTAAHLRHPPADSAGKPGVPAPEGAVPTQTFTGASSEVKVAGVTARLLHPGPGHTDGDLIVLFPAANVISTGDLLGSNNYPNIDLNAGGSIDGMIAGADFIIAHADDKTIVVPGHGPVTNKAGVVAYRNMMQTARDRVAKAKKSGMSEQQVADAHLFADLDAKWTGIKNSSTPKNFPHLIYRSLP
jgi:cyclase